MIHVIKFNISHDYNYHGLHASGVACQTGAEPTLPEGSKDSAKEFLKYSQYLLSDDIDDILLAIRTHNTYLTCDMRHVPEPHVVRFHDARDHAVVRGEQR